MRNVNLEENELTITAIFQQHTKEETIQTLKEALEVLEQEESDPENDEMIEIINSTVVICVRKRLLAPTTATVMTMNFCTVGCGSPAMFSTVF